MTDLLSREEWTKRASQKVARTQLFINGKFVDAASGKTFESINPRDNSIAAVVAEGDKEDIEKFSSVSKIPSLSSSKSQTLFIPSPSGSFAVGVPTVAP